MELLLKTPQKTPRRKKKKKQKKVTIILQRIVLSLRNKVKVLLDVAKKALKHQNRGNCCT